MAGLRETLYSTQARRPSRSLEDTLYGPSLAVNPDDYEQAAIQNTGDFGRGLSSALTGSVSSVQRYLGANESALANQQEAARWAPEIQTTDQVHGFGDAVRYGLGAVGEGVGSALPAIVGGVAGRALAGGRGAYLGASAAYQPVMAGSHMQELDANAATAGMSESDKRWRGTGIGALQAGVEGLAPGYMVNRLARPQALAKTGFGPAVGRAAGVLATDAALEGGGAAVSDVIGQGSVMQLDPTKEYDPNQTFQAGVREAVGGAGMGAVHAPLAVANDYLREGAATGGSLAARGARAGIDAVAPAAGRAYDAAADIFKTSADFHMQHPEFAGLATPLSMPKGMKADDTVGINAYLDAEGAKRNAAAKAMAQRMVDNPDMHSNEDLHEAQSMLTTDDPDAWEGFSKGVGRRQVRENVVDALGRFTNHVSEKFGELKDKAVGTKNNAESTGQDHEFLQSMHKSVTQAADLGDADLTMPLHALKTYVLSGMRDKDGMVDVPDELVEALGDQAPVIIARAYDTLRRQGRTGHFDAEAPALLKEAAEIVKEKQAVQQNVGKLVGDNLTPTAFDTMHHSTWENIGQAVRSYVNRGKKDARLEDALDQWFGPNKEKVIAQIATLSQRDRLRGQELGSEEDTAIDARDTNEDSPSEGTETDYENQMTEKAPAVAYHFKDAENTPFDRADPFSENHMANVPVKLDTSRFVTTKDKAFTDRVRAEQIGVVDHARETGDSSVLDKLMLAHPGMSQNKLNERFRLLKTQERMPDESEDMDIKPRELLAPAERRVGGKRVLNKHSWKDVTALGAKDVSTTEFGRLYLTPGSPEHTNKETGEITPAVKEGKEFVTSAQKIITKMWARGVKTGSSPQAMLEAFTTGLSSLLAAGKFHGEMQVKLPDGTMKVINGMKDLPDDFVLFRTKDKVVTVKDARESGSKAVRAERSKEQVVAKDEAGHELIFKDKKDADKAVTNKDQMVAEHGKNWAVYDNAPESPTKPGIAIDVEARRLATARERGKGETAGPIGERGEGGGRQDHHGLAESDERAVRENEKFDNTERRVDELTGLELQPRGVQSADQRVRLLDKRIDALRAEYKELNDKIKEYAGKTGVNAVREGNLKTWRGKLEVVKAKGLKLGAERAELARVVPGAEQSADNTSALRKIQEARAKARAEKADHKVAEKNQPEKEPSPKPTESKKHNMRDGEQVLPEATLGTMTIQEGESHIWLNGEKLSVNNEEEMEKYQDALEDYALSGSTLSIRVKRMADLHKSVNEHGLLFDELIYHDMAEGDSDAELLRLGFDPKEKPTFDELSKRVLDQEEFLSRQGVLFNKEKTGMSDNRPTNDVEAIDLLYKLLGKDIDAAFTSVGALDGSGTWRRDPKTGKAVIRIAIDALDPTSVAYHEAMHEFMQRLLDDKHSRASKVLQDAANSEPVLRQMQRHFASEPAVLKHLAEDPAERVAYMFQLWAAGKVHVGPQTETVFRKIISLIRKVLGLATNDKNALEIMQNFAAGQMSDRGAIARVLDTQESRGAYLRKVGTIMKPVVERGAEIVGFAENILADSGNPALIQIGKMLHNKTGTQGEAQGYLSAETQAQNKYMNKFAEALRHGDKEDVRLAMEGLQKKEDHADPIVRKIQEGVKAVFKEMYTYMADAGVMRWDEKAGEKGQWVPVKKIDDYRLPVSWDASEIIANSEKFKNLLFEHHAKELAAIAKNANKEVADRKGAGRYTASQEKLANPDGKEITAENVADALIQRLISTNGQVEFQENENALGFSPFMKSVNERSLHWIDQSVFHEFQEKDMALILTTYVGQATKRAEYSRRNL